MHLQPLRKIHKLVDRLKRESVGAALLSLVGDSAIYLSGGILIGLGNVILIPLYTRTLAPRDFGVYALVDVTVLLIVTVTALKLDVSYLKWFADVDRARRGELLGSALLTGLVASTLGGVALSWVAASRLGELWLHHSARTFAWMLLPIVVLENLQALFLTDFRARRRAVSYSATAIIRLVAMVAASYYFLAVRQMGLSGLFYGRLVGDAAAFVFLGIIGLRGVVFKISPSLLGPMLRFGLPLILSIFFVMLQDASGRYTLTHYGTLEQVGLLGAAIKIGAIFQMLVNVPFGVAWGGVLFQIVKERDAQVIYSKIFGYVYVLALGMALVLTIFGPTLFRVFTAPAYYSAVGVLPLVLLVRAASVIEQPSSVGIYLAGRTGFFAAIYGAGLGVNLALLRLFVPRYGLMGVGWAWLLGSAVVPILNLVFGHTRYRLSFNAKLILLPLLPWMFVFLPVLKGFAAGFMNRFVIQCFLSAVVTVGVGALLVYDIRAVRRQLHNRGAGAAVWEGSSQ